MGLTRPPTSLMSASGKSGSKLAVQKDRSIKPEYGDDDFIAEVESGSFDASQGILTLTFADGKPPLMIKGFPNISDVIEGKPGPKGETGDDGEDGRDGKDGDKGDAGCEGPDGRIGQIGETGATGADGKKGDTGATGATGAKGETGATGPTGPTGPRGPTGATGEPGHRGEAGPMGPPGKINIFVSIFDPGPSALAGSIWVNPNVTKAAGSAQWP